MRIRTTGSRNSRSGVALIYSVLGAFVAASMVSVLFTMAGVTNKTAATKRGKLQAQYLAEGAVEYAKKQLAQAIANWQEPPTEGTVEIDGTSVYYEIIPTGLDGIVTAPSGIQTIQVGYEIEATAVVDEYQAQANRVISAESTPIFQFAVFYTDDLEILPGPSMNLGGRVHTNRNMYLGCNNTLSMDTNYVRAIGRVFRRRKNNSSSQGTVEIRKWVLNPFDLSEPAEFVTMNSKSQMTALGIDTSSGYDSTFVDGFDSNGDLDFDDLGDWLPFAPGALEFWKEPDGYTNGTGHTLLTGEHGVQEAATPDIGSIKMYDAVEGGNFVFDAGLGEYVAADPPGSGTHEKGFFHKTAGLSIIVAENGTWKAFDDAGNDITSILAVAGAVDMGSVPDMRQSDSQPDDVPVVQLDLEKLAGHYPANGLLYVAHYGMDLGTAAKGVMLANGAEIASSLTVVSEGSVYVHGDYNTVAKKSCAVIGDSVNLLSNAWDGTKTPGSLPSATDTTYNTGIITGNYNTVGNVYNGGLENLPRFHEKWSNVDCNISGSFVNTWASEYATGLWKYGSDRYKAPRRKWAYDPLFNNVAGLPPFTPMAVTAVDIVSW